MGVSVSVHVNVHVCLLLGCEECVVRNGGGLSITLPAHDK